MNFTGYKIITTTTTKKKKKKKESPLNFAADDIGETKWLLE